MTYKIEYKFHIRELMARAGIHTSRDLVGPLRDRGITLSESQINRIVAHNPDRIAFQVLAALCDVLGVEMNELITFTSSEVKTVRRRVAGDAIDVPLIEAYRPVRARIRRPGDD